MADFAASFCAATKKGRHCRRYWRPFFGFHCIHIIDPMWFALGRLPFQTQYFCSYCLKVYQESLYKDNWTLINILNSEELPLTRSDSSFSQEGCFSMLERQRESIPKFFKEAKNRNCTKSQVVFSFLSISIYANEQGGRNLNICICFHPKLLTTHFLRQAPKTMTRTSCLCCQWFVNFNLK